MIVSNGVSKVNGITWLHDFTGSFYFHEWEFEVKGRTHSLPEGSADPLFTRKIIQNMLSAPKYFENMLNNILIKNNNFP